MDVGMFNNFLIYSFLWFGRDVDVFLVFDSFVDVKIDNWFVVVDGYC